ncbi:MAG TPA: Gfo/Idh/MocA family oxidoreductase [Candidatus Lokiarchaeia archaeon]|nr:Gfo/Idh/MocA family oxidoreductase [Candidatus Lokiarchaeia archaeon]
MSNAIEKQTINVGVIGCGCVSENHIFSISLLENNARKIWSNLDKKLKIKLYALADINDPPLDRMLSAFPVPKIYRGPNAGYDLIDDPDVHAVFVLVPTVHHLDYVLNAAGKGKHVFCEKPLAFYPNDVKKMIESRDANNVVIQPGLVFRSAPQICYLKDLIERSEETWGKPRNVVFRDSQERPYKGGAEVHGSTWRGDKEMAHAGILFEHTIHDIDGLIYAFGEVDEVFGKVQYQDKEGIETSATALFTFKNGVHATINSMWNDVNFSERRMEFYFENAWLHATVDEMAGKDRHQKLAIITYKHLDEPVQELDDVEMDTFFREKINMPHVKPEIPGPYYYEDLRFIDAIVHGMPSPVLLEHGWYAQKVIEAVYASNMTGNTIKIDEFSP